MTSHQRIGSVATFLAAVVLGVAAWSANTTADVKLPMPAGMRQIPTRYYTMYTDQPQDAAQEAAIRMTRMAEEYHERTKGFSGEVRQRLSFYLFTNEEDYFKAGAPPGSAGVFIRRGGDKWLMAQTGIGTAETTWHTVQHEGFHQFADATIGELPTWINEGLAEYFGESLWTGDGFVTGIIPPKRLKMVRDRMSNRQFISLKDMMLMSHAEWNNALSVNNYHQAWSMTHFLAHGDGNKYQNAFVQFMQEISKRHPWEKAWEQSFGSAAGFEEKWKAWWEKQPEDPTAELYTRATLSTLASFVARAHAQKVAVKDLPAFIRMVKAGELKLTGDNWLPPTLFNTAVARMSRDGTTFTVEPGEKPTLPPQVVAVRPDGLRLVATFPARLAIPVKITITAKPGPVPVQATAKAPGSEKPAATTVPPSPGVTAPGAARPVKPGGPVAVAPPPPTSTAKPPTANDDPFSTPGTPPPAPPPPLAPTLRPPGGGVAAAGDGAPAATLIAMAGLPSGRDAFIKYVAENNVFGRPDHKLVTDVTDKVDAAVERNSGISILFGKNLMKSRHVTQITMEAGQCFVAEFSDDHADRLGIAASSIRNWSMRPVRRADKQLVELEAPKFDFAGQLDPTRQVTGSVAVRGLDGLDDEKITLRLAYRDRELAGSHFCTFNRRDGMKSLRFTFLPAGNKMKESRPVVALFDLCRMKKEEGKDVDLEVLSNTITVVVDVASSSDKGEVPPEVKLGS